MRRAGPPRSAAPAAACEEQRAGRKGTGTDGRKGTGPAARKVQQQEQRGAVLACIRSDVGRGRSGDPGRRAAGPAVQGDAAGRKGARPLMD